MIGLKEISLAYFKAFENRNIDDLALRLSEDVVLRDWEIDSIGKENALSSTRQIFLSCKSIEVRVLRMYQVSSTVIAELELTFDGLPSIRVVDILDFDVSEKICSIRAYKG